jgi:hypothetical protein
MNDHHHTKEENVISTDNDLEVEPLPHKTELQLTEPFDEFVAPENHFGCSMENCKSDVFDTCFGCDYCSFPKNEFCKDHLLSHKKTSLTIQVEKETRKEVSEDELEASKLFITISQLKIVF